MSKRSSKAVSSSIPGDVAPVKTPEVTEGNAVMYMYDEIGMNHLTTSTANEISLSKNSAYSSTKEA